MARGNQRRCGFEICHLRPARQLPLPPRRHAEPALHRLHKGGSARTADPGGHQTHRNEIIAGRLPVRRSAGPLIRPYGLPEILRFPAIVRIFPRKSAPHSQRQNRIPAMIHIASRMKRLGTETAFEVLAKARALEAQGKNIIHLQIGEPDFDTPANVRAAGKKAIDDGFTHYSPSAGLMQAREAIAKHVTETRGFKVTPEMVVITPGGKPIMNFAITACVDEGDEVIYPNPGYPIYESVIEFIGAKAVPLPLREDRGFAFDIGDLKKLITPKSRMLILNTPQNPTGGVLGRDLLRQIAELCIKHNLVVLRDRKSTTLNS